MRGKPHLLVDRAAEARIIPAHAGQTSMLCYSLPNSPDHPRACGANVVESFGELCGHGSSPRMRGKQRHQIGNTGTVRIIPAHAGQTIRFIIDWTSLTDHPRACGANSCPVIVCRFCCGSSPRMRGKRHGSVRVYVDGRIIPAHAGQTSRAPSVSPSYSDHPRACGANQCLEQFGLVRFGSSPRMRGKCAANPVEHAAHRIIPAHAGQTAMVP